MREAQWTDADGRNWAVWLPDEAPDSDAHLGIIIGPPSMEGLGLPLEIEVRLHNELYRRRIFEERDARRQPDSVASAMRSALRLSVHSIIEQYVAPPAPPLPG